MLTRLRVRFWAALRSGAGSLAYRLEPPRWEPPEPEHHVYTTRAGRASHAVCAWADRRMSRAVIADWPRMQAEFARWVAKQG